MIQNKSLLKVFMFGVFLGIIFGGMLYNIYIHPMLHYYSSIQNYDSIANRELIKYIEGIWSSATEDLIVRLPNIDNSREIILLDKEKNERTVYNVVKTDLVDGYFGFIIFDLCKNKLECKDDLIKIKVNKLWSDDVIILKFDSNFAECHNKIENKCFRAFQKIM